MLLYIVRHGDPIYDPDSLTELGHLQAAALSKRLARYGLDEIYASPMIRAQQTAEPTAKILKKQVEILDWTSEILAWEDFSFISKSGSRRWIFRSEYTEEMRSAEITGLGYNWFEHPLFSKVNAKAGYQRLLKASDEFFASQGYIHDSENCRYIEKEHNEKRVAVFCHEGFGVSWLGVLLDIPLPMAWSIFNKSHSTVTLVKIEPNEKGICAPQILTFSNDSHIYSEGLPTKHQNIIYY